MVLLLSPDQQGTTSNTKKTESDSELLHLSQPLSGFLNSGSHSVFGCAAQQKVILSCCVVGTRFRSFKRWKLFPAEHYTLTKLPVRFLLTFQKVCSNKNVSDSF